MMNNTITPDNTPTPLEVQRRMQEQLPRTWRLDLEEFAAQRGLDAVLDLRAPDGRRATILVEIKRQLDPVSVPRIRERMQSWVGWSTTAKPLVAFLVAAPYLSQRTRERLRSNDLNYLDLTGNTFVALEDPAVCIRTQGADKDPNKSSRPMRSLRGAKTAKVVRALADFRPPLGVRQIAQIARTDPGNVSRLLDMLEREDLVQRGSEGGIGEVRWDELLRTWTRDYSLEGSNRVTTYLDPRGLENLKERLRELPEEVRYAVSGSLAAIRLAPLAPARLGVVFVNDAASVAAALGLARVEAGANTLLVEPRGDFVFDRTFVDEGITYAAPSQVVADLLTGPGRNPVEGEELLAWMKRNEDVWRT